jgi:hypothetical protein
MSTTPQPDKHDAKLQDQQDMPDTSTEGELNEQQLNDVAGGLLSRLRNDNPNDAYVRRTDDTSDLNDALARQHRRPTRHVLAAPGVGTNKPFPDGRVSVCTAGADR